MADVVTPALREPARALVQAHRQAGDQLVIVTATNEFVTRPIAAAFGIDELIAVELESGPDGWINGEIRGVPSAREGKVTRMEQWLAARGLCWDDVECTFYSDSVNDRITSYNVCYTKYYAMAAGDWARITRLAQEAVALKPAAR